MHTRTKASLMILAAIGAFSSVQFLSSAAHAQQQGGQGGAGGGFGGGQGGAGGFGGGQGGAGGGGFGGQGGGFQRRPMANNMTAKVTIGDAIRTATGKVSGYVNSATLRPLPPSPGGPGGPGQGGGGIGGGGGQGGGGFGGGAGQPPKLVWVIHVVTAPGAGPNQPGKGENVAVDAQTGSITEMPPQGPGFGGPGGPGGFGGG